MGLDEIQIIAEKIVKLKESEINIKNVIENLVYELIKINNGDTYSDDKVQIIARQSHEKSIFDKDKLEQLMLNYLNDKIVNNILEESTKKVTNEGGPVITLKNIKE